MLNLGDSITTDHISPAGSIAKVSPAAVYLNARGVEQKEFNSYGSRRGNDEIMMRGTFANIRIVNKLASKTGPMTLYVPTGEELPIFDAAQVRNSSNIKCKIDGIWNDDCVGVFDQNLILGSTPEFRST